MKRHSKLYEKIAAFPNLLEAVRKALRGKKHKTGAARFHFHLEKELIILQKELVAETYRPGDYRSFEIYEPKKRIICAALFRDRVVHHAICNIIEPILDRTFIYDTYACRRDKGVHKAVKRTQEFCRKWKYFLKCDIRKFFESIDHMVLKNQLGRKFKDKQLLQLLNFIIDYPVPGYDKGKGLPIGNLKSQNFFNYYIGRLDHFVKEILAVKGYIRYMDDFLLFSDDKGQLWECLMKMREYLRQELQLVIKDNYLVAPVGQGVTFVGFRIYPSLIRLDRNKWVRFMRKVRQREGEYIRGDITERQLAQSVDSMIGHIIHVNTLMARKKFFESSICN